MSPTAALQVIDLLKKHAEKIRSFEQDAHTALHEKNDPEAANTALKAKTTLLANLMEETASFIPELPEDFCDELLDGLESFARRAQQAITLKSPFFMTQLLYPEDYQEGQANELEQFITRMEHLL